MLFLSLSLFLSTPLEDNSAIISRDKISHSRYGFEDARENTVLQLLRNANQWIAQPADADTASEVFATRFYNGRELILAS